MEQETITVELTRQDAVNLVRSVPLWNLSFENYRTISKMKLVKGARELYSWEWVSVYSEEWDNFTVRQLYDLYNNIK